VLHRYLEIAGHLAVGEAQRRYGLALIDQQLEAPQRHLRMWPDAGSSPAGLQEARLEGDAEADHDSIASAMACDELVTW